MLSTVPWVYDKLIVVIWIVRMEEEKLADAIVSSHIQHCQSMTNWYITDLGKTLVNRQKRTNTLWVILWLFYPGCNANM